MAHLTLQLGTALVVPFPAPGRGNPAPPPWRGRALREAIFASPEPISGDWIWCDRRLLPNAIFVAAARGRARVHSWVAADEACPVSPGARRRPAARRLRQHDPGADDRRHRRECRTRSRRCGGACSTSMPRWPNSASSRPRSEPSRSRCFRRPAAYRLLRLEGAARQGGGQARRQHRLHLLHRPGRRMSSRSTSRSRSPRCRSTRCSRRSAKRPAPAPPCGSTRNTTRSR